MDELTESNILHTYSEILETRILPFRFHFNSLLYSMVAYSLSVKKTTKQRDFMNIPSLTGLSRDHMLLLEASPPG